MAKSVGNIRLLADALDAHGRDALIMYFLAGHYRQPLAYCGRALERGGAPRRARSATSAAGRRLGRRAGGPSPSRRRAARERSSTRCATTSTRRRRSRRCSSWVREGNRRPRPASVPGDARPRARCSACSGSRSCSTPTQPRRPGGASGWREEREQARARPGLRARRPRCATSWPRRLRGPRQRATARCSSGARRDGPASILYGRNAVREALRGPRAVLQRVGEERAAREPWLRGAPHADRGAPSELERPLRLARPPGDLRRGRARTATPTPAALLAADDALVVALDQVQDPQNLGADLPHGRVRRRDRRRDPRAPQRRGHAGRLQGVGRRGRAPARSRACATSRTSCARRSSRGAWATAPTAAPRPPTPSRTTGAGRAGARRAREQGCARACAATCDELVALPLRGRIESLNVSAAAAALLYEITRQQRA